MPSLGPLPVMHGLSAEGPSGSGGCGGNDITKTRGSLASAAVGTEKPPHLGLVGSASLLISRIQSKVGSALNSVCLTHSGHERTPRTDTSTLHWLIFGR